MDTQLSYNDLIARLERATDLWQGYTKLWIGEDKLPLALAMHARFKDEFDWWKDWAAEIGWSFRDEYRPAMALRVSRLVKSVCETVLDEPDIPVGFSCLACARLLLVLNSVNSELHGGW